MPRPMTTYRSGIRTVTVSRWLHCPDCGQESFRSRTFEGPAGTVEADADAWSPDPRCLPHLRAAMRLEVGP